MVDGNQMRLTWPAGKGCFVVESSNAISGGQWETVGIRPVQDLQMMVIDLPIRKDGMRFFRVRNWRCLGQAVFFNPRLREGSET